MPFAWPLYVDDDGGATAEAAEMPPPTPPDDADAPRENVGGRGWYVAEAAAPPTAVPIGGDGGEAAAYALGGGDVGGADSRDCGLGSQFAAVRACGGISFSRNSRETPASSSGVKLKSTGRGRLDSGKRA